MSKLKISIVTVSYNQGNFIEETIQSVLDQNYDNLEYIIIDGGSTDNSVEIIKKYESQLAYWVSEKDKGAGDALNKGFAKATGDYIYYLNSDDLLLPGVLQYFAELQKNNPSHDVYYSHGYMLMNETGKKYPIYSDLWSLEQFRSGVVSIIQQSTFIKKTAYEKTAGFNISNRTCWDGELIVDLALSGASFFRYKKHVALFRMHGESITGSQTVVELHKKTMARVREKIDAVSKTERKTKNKAKLLQIANDPLVQTKRLIAKIMRP